MEQTEVNVSGFQLSCSKCGGLYFSLLYKFMVANNSIIPLAVYECKSCGAVTDPNMPNLVSNTDQPKEEPKKPEPKKEEPKKEEPKREEPRNEELNDLFPKQDDEFEDLTEEFLEEPPKERKRGRPRKA